MVKWLTFAHYPICIVSIFKSDSLRFYKSSIFDPCKKYSHTHTLSNARISGWQIPPFRELLAHKYEQQNSDNSVVDTFDFWSNGSLLLINQFLMFQYLQAILFVYRRALALRLAQIRALMVFSQEHLTIETIELGK